MDYAVRITGITFCGAIGAAIGWALTSLLEWTGPGGAFAAAVIAMTSGTLLWAAGVALTDALRQRRQPPDGLFD